MDNIKIHTLGLLLILLLSIIGMIMQNTTIKEQKLNITTTQKEILKLQKTHYKQIKTIENLTNNPTIITKNNTIEIIKEIPTTHYTKECSEEIQKYSLKVKWLNMQLNHINNITQIENLTIQKDTYKNQFDTCNKTLTNIINQI